MPTAFATVLCALYLSFSLLAIRNSFQRHKQYLYAWRISATLLSLGLLNLLVYGVWIIGATDKNIALHKPLFLVASSSILCISGICIALVLLLLNLANKITKRR